jgi:(1->4)-alpha-D-glucan 1-alpha-D-glucosylmutase
MLATSTHDTKRSEDVRARLALLSEVPDKWAEAVRRWSHHNDQHRSGESPDRNAEYIYYQTLIGAWPIDPQRALEFMMKAVREAKQHTAWTRQDADYEAALAAFVEKTLADSEFVADLENFVSTVIAPGQTNSLAQTLLKLTAPGVPDLYQGTELWDLSLVDPDNRRPVEFDERRRLLAELKEATVEQVIERSREGAPKLWLIRQALGLRQRRPELFGAEGGYEPLDASGPRADHVIAFARGARAVTVAPRWPIVLGGDWAATTLTLPPGPWHNELTGDTLQGGPVEIAALLARFPVALLSQGDQE